MIQMSIFDVTENKHKGNARSKEARARTNVTGRRKQVLDYITSQGTKGATSYEISKALDIPLHAISGRCSELKMTGAVRVAGVRENESGVRADVLVAVVRVVGGFRYDNE